MADEIKKRFNAMSLLKMFAGVLILVIGILFTFRYFPYLKLMIKASLGPFLILVGLIMVAVAKE
jgi:hypothetical protein